MKSETPDKVNHERVVQLELPLFEQKLVANFNCGFRVYKAKIITANGLEKQESFVMLKKPCKPIKHDVVQDLTGLMYAITSSQSVASRCLDTQSNVVEVTDLKTSLSEIVTQRINQTLDLLNDLFADDVLNIKSRTRITDKERNYKHAN